MNDIKFRLILSLFILTPILLKAQTPKKTGDPALSEIWSPVPKVIAAGKTPGDAPSDAIVLFNGKDLASWVLKDGKPAGWTVDNGVLTVNPRTGDIQTKQGFGDCQLHIEWRTPSVVSGTGQGRGNSGIFLMGRYELQVLDSYNNSTYSNGQAGSVYKQHIPMVNVSRAPGDWQTYDVIFIAPQFYEGGALKSAARMTVLHNGVLIQNNVSLWGSMSFIGIPEYQKHNVKEPIILQDHHNPVSFRNIWIREL